MGDLQEVARANAVAAQHRLADLSARMLDRHGTPTDSRWWFTSSYVRTTEGAIGEADAGSFRDPVFIFRLITYFEKLYLDNIAAADAGRSVEPHWGRAFAASSRVDAKRRLYSRVGAVSANQTTLRGVVSSVVAASRAHIRYDLPRAMAWVHSTPVTGTAAEFDSYIDDFMAMAAVFERATLAANIDVARHTHLPLNLMPRRLQDWGMRNLFHADLIHERAFAWECARALVTADAAGRNPYAEPQPGRLEGDITAGPVGDTFSVLSADLRPTMDGVRRAPPDGVSRRGGRAPDRLNTVERIRALQGLCHGFTGPGDERAIMALLAASARIGDLVPVVNGVGAWELAINLHGRERRALRTLLRTYYYPNVQHTIAVALLRRALRFVELPWEDDMVADLLCDRADCRELMAGLSGGVSGGDREGWRRIRHGLGARSQARVLAAHQWLR